MGSLVALVLVGTSLPSLAYFGGVTGSLGGTIGDDFGFSRESGQDDREQFGPPLPEGFEFTEPSGINFESNFGVNRPEQSRPIGDDE